MPTTASMPSRIYQAVAMRSTLRERGRGRAARAEQDCALLVGQARLEAGAPADALAWLEEAIKADSASRQRGHRARGNGNGADGAWRYRRGNSGAGSGRAVQGGAPRQRERGADEEGRCCCLLAAAALACSKKQPDLSVPPRGRAGRVGAVDRFPVGQGRARVPPRLVARGADQPRAAQPRDEAGAIPAIPGCTS